MVRGEPLHKSIVVEGRGGFIVPPMTYPLDPQDLLEQVCPCLLLW